MERIDIATRIELVKAYYSSGESSTAALRKYKREHHLPEHICAESSVRHLIARFEATGSVSDLPRSGRPPVSEEVVSHVAATMVELQKQHASGSASTADVSTALQLPRSTVKKVLKSYLKWRPYRMHLLQHLYDKDMESRKEFANWFLQRHITGNLFLHRVLWTDEANFLLDGGVYTHQCIIWAPENPHIFTTKSLYPSHITVWCGFTADFIIGPFFFDEATVTGQRYLTMLQQFVVPELQRHRALHKVFFQQDGAPPHIATAVKEFLSATFNDRVISRSFPLAWPPRSPDLAPNDYWLWGMIKSKVYASNPHSSESLKAAIRDEIGKISPADLRAAVENLPFRLRALLHEDGGHFEHYF